MKRYNTTEHPDVPYIPAAVNVGFLYVPLFLVIYFTFGYVHAEEFFNPSALEIDNPSSTPVDLSQFSRAGNHAPGNYYVQVYINGEFVGLDNIEFASEDNRRLQPRLSLAMLEGMGVNIASLPIATKYPRDKLFTPFDNSIPQAKSDFDFEHLKLSISIPQVYMKSDAQGAVESKYWDQGITAAMVNYDFSGSNTWSDGSTGGDNKTDSYYLNLRSGVNISGWRLRNYSAWSYSKNSASDNNGYDTSNSKWDSINTFIQHDVPVIKGTFVAGESYTPSDVFDSIQFRGVQVASDDNMLPDSLRGFAPTIRGIANSNAQVTVRQNGSIIYQTYVSPGVFAINDLYPTATSGDLVVTVRESNGNERTFTQPFANVPIMQREGRLKYGFTVGEYRSSSYDAEKSKLGQLSLIYGLSNELTIYGGTQLSQYYNAFAAGVGFGLGGLGAISLDATKAYTESNSNATADKEGQSYRVQYAKNVQATDSTITLAGYRYSTDGFYTFNEAMDFRDLNINSSVGADKNKRSKVQFILSQNLMGGDWGSLSFSGYQQDYWDYDGYERNFNVSYNSSWKGITWSLMYAYTSSPFQDQGNDQQLALNISIPLSRWLSNSYVNNSFTVDKHGKSLAQTGVSGTALENNNLSYSVAQGYGNQGAGYSGLINADYRGTYGEVSSGYNYNNDSRQINYGAQGVIVVHQHGLTLGQPNSGDLSAMALVRAPGAGGAKVINSTGVNTDWRGYTIVPYLNPYKRTRITLDPGTLKENVELSENVKTVVPTSGAIVLADFNTRVGARALIVLTRGEHVVPFGSTVTLLDDNSNTGIVGEDGQVYMSGLPEEGTLMASWGEGGSQYCRANYMLSAQGNASGIQQASAKCE
jgi:outer membrane usher protein